MTDAGEKLKREAAQLSQQDRAELARFLLHSLDAEEEEGYEAAWDAELERRMKEIESGQEAGEAAEQVFERLRKKYS